MKQCSKCKRTKPKIEFNKNKNRKDGLKYYCRECTIKQHHDDSKVKKPLTEKQRINKRKSRADYIRKNPEKIKAVSKVNYALKMKRITKTPCIKCGNVNSQAHHEDYSKPLEVVWLCKRCHSILHANKKRNLGTNNKGVTSGIKRA